MILVNVGQGSLDPTVRVPSAPLSGLNSYDLRFHVSFISGKSRYSSTWVRNNSSSSIRTTLECLYVIYTFSFCTPPRSLGGSHSLSGGSPSRSFALGIRLPSWPPIVLSSSLSSIMIRGRVASLMRHSTNASS